MKIGVTGATGLLGGEVCRNLIQAGHHPVGFGRNREKGEQLQKEGIPFKFLDLCNLESIQMAFSKLDAVVHCAALSSPWGSAEAFQLHNLSATQHVINACRQQSIPRLIHISTPSIFAALQDQLDISEDCPPATPFLNHYARTKWQCEQALASAANENFQVTVFRPQAILGPGEQAIFPRFLRVNQQKGIPLIRGGCAITDMTPTENVADAITLALTQAPSHPYRVYHLSNGDPRRLLDVITQVLQGLNQPLRTRPLPINPLRAITGILETTHRVFPRLGEPVLTRYSLSILGYSRTLDIQRVQSELGFTPRISIDTCIENMIRWWRDAS